jgi:peptide-methionine (R)-S-oxide reductase
MPFSGNCNDCKEEGIYQCVCCGNELLALRQNLSQELAGLSFWAPIKEDNLIEQADNGMFMRRTVVLYNKCDAHLGHVFDDGPAPTNQLYQFCLSQTREEELRK